VVAKPPSVGIKFAKYTLTAQAYQDTAGNVHPASEKVIIYLPNDLANAPQAGDELMIGAVFNPIAPPPNPYEFNSAQYLRRTGIFCAAFVDSAHCVVTAHNKLPPFAAFCQAIRRNSVKILENTGISGEELGVLLTLTLGDHSRLDADLRNSYTVAGAAHVLSVSGAHVMMIAMILGCILLPVRRSKRGRIVGGCAIQVILWTYALITGFAPPVTRATIMFSLITTGDMLTRKGNSYNNLAFAALLLCLFDPNNLYNVGFQLSFVAVLAIVFFHPRIKKLIYVKNKILAYVWSAAAMGIAANLGTFPIIVYVFHQFPTYFIITSVLIALPTTLILTFFVIAFILSLIPLINLIVPFIAYPLKWSIMLLNGIVRTVESIPGSVTEGLWMDELQAWTLMIGILLLALLLWTKRRRLIFGVGFCMLAFFAMRAKTLYARQQQCLLAVYSVKNTTLFSFISVNKSFTVCDSNDFVESFDFNLKAYMASLGLKSVNDIPKISLQDLPRINDEQYNIYHSHIGYYGKTIAVAAQNAYSAPPQRIAVDFLIITSQCRQNPQEIFAVYQPQQVVLDASLSRSRQRRWVEYMASNGINFHNVGQSGAFVCDVAKQ
jgi:competence protein ComEC